MRQFESYHNLRIARNPQTSPFAARCQHSECERGEAPRRRFRHDRDVEGPSVNPAVAILNPDQRVIVAGRVAGKVDHVGGGPAGIIEVAVAIQVSIVAEYVVDSRVGGFGTESSEQAGLRQ